MKSTWTLVVLAASVGSVGCGVGTYHIPDVAPVVTPEPEEDIFGDLDFDDVESTDKGEEKTDEGDGAASEPSEPAPTEAKAEESAAEVPAEASKPAGDAAKPKGKAPD
jgi:hypothetical protein